MITVELGGVGVARTPTSLRVLGASHPPTYYLPRDAFVPGALKAADGASWCEWKGQAAYFDVVGGTPTSDPVVAAGAAWTYPAPSRGFEALAGAVAVMPAAMDRCTVD